MQDQQLTGNLEDFADSLASISLGSRYTDSITGFSGVATSRLISMSEPEQILLESDSSHRWCPVNRLHDENDQPVISSSETVSSGSSS